MLQNFKYISLFSDSNGFAWGRETIGITAIPVSTNIIPFTLPPLLHHLHTIIARRSGDYRESHSNENLRLSKAKSATFFPLIADQRNVEAFHREIAAAALPLSPFSPITLLSFFFSPVISKFPRDASIVDG